MKPLLIGGLFVLAVACVAGSWMFMKSSEPPMPDVWYYDLNTKDLFAGKADSTPPIKAPSGDLTGAAAGTAAGVRALVVKDGSDGKRVVLLMTSAPDGPGIGLVKRPEDSAWVSQMSGEGQKMFGDAQAQVAKNGQSLP